MGYFTIEDNWDDDGLYGLKWSRVQKLIRAVFKTENLIKSYKYNSISWLLNCPSSSDDGTKIGLSQNNTLQNVVLFKLIRVG